MYEHLDRFVITSWLSTWVVRSAYVQCVTCFQLILLTLLLLINNKKKIASRLQITIILCVYAHRAHTYRIHKHFASGALCPVWLCVCIWHIIQVCLKNSIPSRERVCVGAHEKKVANFQVNNCEIEKPTATKIMQKPGKLCKIAKIKKLLMNLNLQWCVYCFVFCWSAVQNRK